MLRIGKLSWHECNHKGPQVREGIRQEKEGSSDVAKEAGRGKK